MRTITADQWTPDVEAYLWTEPGDGQLLRVTGIRADWWIVTGRLSWCCTPGTVLYVLPRCEHAQVESDLQSMLKARRAGRPPIAFNGSHVAAGYASSAYR